LPSENILRLTDISFRDDNPQKWNNWMRSTGGIYIWRSGCFLVAHVHEPLRHSGSSGHQRHDMEEDGLAPPQCPAWSLRPHGAGPPTS
jgi:hypothetical protein